MDKNSNTYTFIFVLIVCAACSFLLAFVSEGLRPARESNEAYDMKKNILTAVEFSGVSKHATMKDVMGIYEKKIEEIMIDGKGSQVEGKVLAEIKEEEEFYPLYIYREEGKVVAYAFPVYGKGLWSTIYGFLGLEADAITIRGATFYKHGETPGLGGEVSSLWFQKSFKGKRVYDVGNDELRPVQVIKGKVADKLSGRDMDFAVDGISGATITSKGVSKFLDKWIKVYEPYFSKVRNGYKDTGMQEYKKKIK